LSELLEIRDLIVNFYTDHGVVKALDSCNLVVKKGKVVSLIGESGCGKTTIAKSILGVVPSPPGKVLEGEILFDGQDLLRMKERVLNSKVRGKAITLIPQDPFTSFNPVFTIGTQISDIMKYKGPQLSDIKGEKAKEAPCASMWSSRERRKRDRDRIISILEELQIPSPESQLSKYPYELSGGQRQRIMIGMALLPNPLMIIADEPTTALDVTIEAQILRLLGQLVKEYYASVLFITHDLGVASQIGDRIVIMYAGQEMESAPIFSFFEQPCHPYTKKLLESLPNPRGEIKDIPGEVPSLIGPLPGCRFYSRCDFATSKCKEGRPLIEEILGEHWIRCFNWKAGEVNLG